jgi:hypothetical protein
LLARLDQYRDAALEEERAKRKAACEKRTAELEAKRREAEAMLMAKMEARLEFKEPTSEDMEPKKEHGKKMDIQQMLERLLAGQARMQAKMDAWLTETKKG